MRAIVIDDSRAMRGILKRLLTASGFGVDEAPDGAAAIEVLARIERPALALVDWNMPNMNGLEFIRAIRADASFAAMKILMVTTEVEMTQVASALEAGADEYMMKPFDEAAFKEKLAILELGTPPEQAVA